MSIQSRNNQILEEYSQGIRQPALAKKYKISHQRVQQILLKFPEYYTLKKINIEKKYEVVSCLYCRKEFKKLKSNHRRCCSKRCANDYKYIAYLEKIRKQKNKDLHEMQRRKSSFRFLFFNVIQRQKKISTTLQKMSSNNNK